jgi:hypothetical protein
MNKSILKIFFILLAFGALSINATAQDKPAPVKSETFDMLIGTWESEPHQMMGTNWTDEVTHTMKHNGQYMFIDIGGKDDKGNTYSGTIVIVPGNTGSFTGFGFDDWGGVTTYTGKADGNKIHVEGKSSWGTEVRDIEIGGKTMTHVATWTMKDKEGKEVVQKETVVFKKK